MEKLLTGVDYYPEQWGLEFLENDIKLMKDAGVNVVRIAEFAWSRMEPEEGKYDFDWLDTAVNAFSENDISVILCTPTNTPPLWLYKKYPDTLQMNRKGERIQTGVRGHRCLVSSTYHRLSENIIRKLVKRYKDNKSVIGWQIDNELESGFCSCPECTDKFRSWLKNKYNNQIGNINETYGNVVWSGEYSSFDEIVTPPDYPDNFLNPAYMLDYYRFASDMTVEYVKFQTELIKEISPQTKITTNAWFCEHMPDFYKLYECLDYVSYDNYPSSDIKNLASHAFHLDFMRGIKNKTFCIMEQLSGTVGSWMPMQRTLYPGMLKGYSLQAFAHGADSVLQFRFRSAVKGAEMFWHGLIEHNNIPGRRYKEYAELTKEIASLDKEGLAGSKVLSEVAVLYNPEDEYAFKIQPQSEDMYYLKAIKNYHEAFMRLGIGVDVINLKNESDNMDLTKYKIIVAPSMYVYNKQTDVALHEYVEKGGHLIITPRSGVKDEFNNCIMDMLPTWLRDLAGINITEYDSLGNDNCSIKINDASWNKKIKMFESTGENAKTDDLITGTQWCDIMETTSAKVLAVYNDNFYQATPVITENKYNAGMVYYVGTYISGTTLAALLSVILDKKDILTGLLPEGIEITKRQNPDKTFTFIFNRNAVSKSFEFEKIKYNLNPFEMKVLIK